MVEHLKEKLFINNAIIMLCNRKVSRVKNTNLFNQFDDVSDTFWEKRYHLYLA